MIVPQVLLTALLLSASPTFEVQTLDGRTIVAGLADLNAQTVVLQESKGTASLPTSQILSIAAPTSPQLPKPSHPVTVALIDGSTIAAKQYLATGPTAKVTLPDNSTLDIPTKYIQTVQLQAAPETILAEWSRLVQNNSAGDLLVTRKEQTLDYHLGTLHDVTDNTIQFDLDGETLPIKKTKVFGIAYRHTDAKPMPAPLCRLLDADGSLWMVHAFSATEKTADRIAWSTPTGVRVASKRDKIRQIDFSGGKVLFLSDLKPERSQWTPFFNAGKPPEAAAQFFSPRFDRGFDQKPLQLAGADYRKGIALQCRSELVYRLPDGFNALRAVVGIADSVRPHGNVRLLIRADEKTLFDAPITGKDAPRTLELNITGVRRLTITAQQSNGLAPGGCLLLCNARLSK